MEMFFQPFGPMDWDMYSGAEGNPTIAHLSNVKLDGLKTELHVIADEEAICLFYYLPEGEDVALFQFYNSGQSRNEAIAKMLDLRDVTEDQLKTLQFRPIYNNTKPFLARQ